MTFSVLVIPDTLDNGAVAVSTLRDIRRRSPAAAYGVLPVPRVDLATIAAAAGHHQEAARILRNEVCHRSDDDNPPLELSERTEQILASRDWPSPMKSAT